MSCAKTPMVLTWNSSSENRTEPVSATPRGERTMLDQREQAARDGITRSFQTIDDIQKAIVH